ncbi:Rhodanese-like domain-containing protein [Gemmobacter megaterium]|uniref:Rhodanese-like domain-containing protein n=1 Tax=Gemmobacter megaterium TaxID=1086013 RepID=A0A1N7Q9R8_9RHOB|nr:rhodanese-like domain-containing protein [Gemmobacter megaterium]GGE24738.1 hypothetical protein GCM10011345_33390 [Gemmobacter megaterium]SIT19576.1 Rhodanese-like domain-containing protein [Gemmobacter megaterium]
MLTLAALAADPDRFHLIDVRDADDYAAAQVTGAVHIPLAALEARVGEIPTDRTPKKIPRLIWLKDYGLRWVYDPSLNRGNSNHA